MPRRATTTIDTHTNPSSKPTLGRKRAREPEEHGAESETAPTPTKKVKGPTNSPNPGPPIRRSSRTKATTQTTTQARKSRTKAQKAADKATIEEAKRQKEAAAERCLARMDADDAMARAQTAAKTVRWLSDVVPNSDGEEFVGFNEVSGSSDESEGGEDYEVSGSSDESEGGEDYETAYKVLQEKMKALKQKMEGDGGRKKAAGGKKLTKGTAYASGLLRDSGLRVAKERSNKGSKGVIISAGGLEDADADAVNPYTTQCSAHTQVPKATAGSGNLKRDLSRQNTLVTIVPNEGFEPVKQGSRRPTKNAESEKKVPAPTRVKSLPDNKENSGASVEANNKTKKRRLITTNNVRISDLPDFAQNQTWKNAFLPTLFAKFFASTEPFADFAKGSDAFIALLQGVVKEVYPNVKYKVSACDPIHALAYNRINEKRSVIGSSAVDIIKQYISTLKGEKAVHDWLLWASRGDGPLYFREPVAPDAPLDTDNPKYKHPGGRLMSPFLINLTGSNLRAKSGSVWKSGPPVGLVALVMAAYERAIRLLLHPPAPKESAPDFSSSSCGSLVKDFVKTLRKIEENQWKMFLVACGSDKAPTEVKDDEYQANLSFMDRRRAALFDIPSPVKV